MIFTEFFWRIPVDPNTPGLQFSDFLSQSKLSGSESTQNNQAAMLVVCRLMRYKQPFPLQKVLMFAWCANEAFNYSNHSLHCGEQTSSINAWQWSGDVTRSVWTQRQSDGRRFRSASERICMTHRENPAVSATCRGTQACLTLGRRKYARVQLQDVNALKQLADMI